MFCKSCGFNVGEEKGFCPGCGIKVEQETGQLVTFPNNGRQFDKNQLFSERALVIKSDSTKVIAGMLGVFALLSVAVGTSFLVMSMIMASEGKKAIKIENDYFEDEDPEKEYYKKVIDFEEEDNSTYIEVKE